MRHAPALEALEPRRLFAAEPWAYWPAATGMVKVAEQFPWLDGQGFNVAVIDKGIDYWHPAIGGDRATATKAPRVVNVYDYRDEDKDPFPSEHEKVDSDSAHALGVAGILGGVPYTAPDGLRYTGLLQKSLLYNLRTDHDDSQVTIRKALRWVAHNAARLRITAINLTDFVGVTTDTTVYDREVRALYDAGVFMVTPVANMWNNPDTIRFPISQPAKHPLIYGIGGMTTAGALTPITQRGPGLDLLGPAEHVGIPYYVPSRDEDIWVTYSKGNSWAAPHVAGAGVLLQQIDPTITPPEIMSILQGSGSYTADPDAQYTGIPGYKRLNVLRAVHLAYWRRDDASDRADGGNDDEANATPLPFDDTGRAAATDLKLLVHDHDYYALDVPEAGRYDFAVDYAGPSRYPTAQLTDATGAVLANIRRAHAADLAPGRYYLHLYRPAQSVIGTYDLSVTRTETPPPVSTTPSLRAPARLPQIGARRDDLLSSPSLLLQ